MSAMLPQTRSKRGLVDVGGSTIKFLLVTRTLTIWPKLIPKIKAANDEIINHLGEQLTILDHVDLKSTQNFEQIKQLTGTFIEFVKTPQSTFQRTQTGMEQTREQFDYSSH